MTFPVSDGNGNPYLGDDEDDYDSLDWCRDDDDELDEDDYAEFDDIVWEDEDEEE